MTRRNLWRLLLVLFVLAWSITELYPPGPRDLLKTFQELAEVKDTNFNAIVTQAMELQKRNTNQPYLNLLTAVGTNDLRQYFPALVDEEDRDPSRAILNRIQKKAAGRIKLGLDLQGGTAFLVSLDTTRMAKIEDREHAVAQAVEVLRKRVDRFGVSEPIIAPEGENNILIQLPGLTEADKDRAKTTIQKAAFLEFRLVHPESESLVKGEIIEPGYEIKIEKRQRKGQEGQQHAYLVSKEPAKGLTGKYVERSGVQPDPMTGVPKIHVSFNTEGAKLFGEVTAANVNHQLAIILDGELYSAPNINEPIMGGNCEISGGFDWEEAYELANVLQNPLEAPVHLESERGVDPSLGKDSIQSGIRASVIGTVLVVLFMLVYYFIAGAVANIALMLNIVILFGVLCSVGTTLTMPGIAGLVLTIGMAVDANVLIYERIREELAAGKSLRGALSAGYDKAFVTIFDSNLTTVIGSVIMIFMGTGPVKGFGVTLTIGITASMFTALVVTRLIFDFLLAKGWLRSLPMLHLIRGANFDFMKYAVPAFAISWTLIVVGNGYGLYRGKEALGIDFAGGDKIGMRFQQKVDAAQVRDALTAAKLGEVSIQYPKDMATGKETLEVVAELGAGQRAQEALVKAFPSAKFERISSEQIGATVGREIQKTAIVATLLALFGILIYVAFRYEFSFAIGAVIGLIHDIVMTTGWFFLTGRQMNAPIIAVLLTIIGFSINDTIVIFDRIREDLKLGVKGTFREVMNKALNQTLSRTIITSGTVFLATASLYFFGGGVINDFAFAFLVGIVTGTYSSIYISSAFVLWWHKGHRPDLGSQVVMDSTVAQKA